MSNLENIVPQLELCKQIPAGEFEDSALAWVYDDVVGFLCRTSGCEQIHKREWQLEHNHPRKIAIRRKCGKEIYPAPTLEEIINKLTHEYEDCRFYVCDNGIEYDTPDGWLLEDTNFCNEPDGFAAAALRLWFKVKGIEVK